MLLYRKHYFLSTNIDGETMAPAMKSARLVGTSWTNDTCFPIDWESAHRAGIPHRAVHMEIVDPQGRLLVRHRRDGRLENPGGHVDWLERRSRAETYDEAAVRETLEELALVANWRIERRQVEERLRGALAPVTMIVNQLPSSHGLNNEWVAVYRVVWPPDWADPSADSWTLDEEEGGSRPSWQHIADLERLCSADPKRLNAALRLLLQRRGILIPLTP